MIGAPPKIPNVNPMYETNPYREQMPVDLMKRPGWSKSGTAAQITLNSYQVTNYPGETIAQYDVSSNFFHLHTQEILKYVRSGSMMDCRCVGSTRRSGGQRPWRSGVASMPHHSFMMVLGSDSKSYRYSCILQSNIAFSATNVIKPEQQKIDVDLDAEKGFADTGPKKNKKRDSHYVIIRYSAVVHTGVLREYLAGKTDFSRNVLEAISTFPSCSLQNPLTFPDFLDHVLRETPTKHSIAIKRSFYGRFLDREIIGGTKKFGKGLCAVEAMKGLYQSIRCAQVCYLGDDRIKSLLESSLPSCLFLRSQMIEYQGKGNPPPPRPACFSL